MHFSYLWLHLDLIVWCLFVYPAPIIVHKIIILKSVLNHTHHKRSIHDVVPKTPFRVMFFSTITSHIIIIHLKTHSYIKPLFIYILGEEGAFELGRQVATLLDHAHSRIIQSPCCHSLTRNVAEQLRQKPGSGGDTDWAPSFNCCSINFLYSSGLLSASWSSILQTFSAAPSNFSCELSFPAMTQLIARAKLEVVPSRHAPLSNYHDNYAHAQSNLRGLLT